VTIPARFAANVAWLFTDLPWPARFGAAADAGFSQVEFPWPSDPLATADAVHAAGLGVAMLNMPAGDLPAGERGWPNDPGRTTEWRAAFLQALDLASSVACERVNVLAGNGPGGVPRATQLASIEANLRWALPLAADAGVTLVTELLNRRENSDYLLVTLDDAAPLLERLGPLGWRLQLDTYHLALTVADVPTTIRAAGGNIGHVQVADVPGRHEPGSGSLDWAAIGAALEDAGYRGAIGLEYRPLTGLIGHDWLTG
jgi:hydroxypyruvate isomerase